MGTRGRPRHPDVLTPREWEVLGLLREGLTNEQIAERLGVSFATARYHVSEILSKLGVSSREEAAAWQPGPERRTWWRLAWPLTLAKAAGIALAVAALVGLGVLGWSVLGTDAGERSVVGEAEMAFLRGGEIWVANADGSDARRLTTLFDDANAEAVNRRQGAHGLTWSPDGRHLAVIAGAGNLGFGGGVYAVDLEGNIERIGNVAYGDVFDVCELTSSFIQWSPDSFHLSYWSGGGRVTDLDGGESNIRGGSTATWSPDGGSLIFTIFGAVDAGCPIVVAPLDDLSEGRHLTYGQNPLWSPDGNFISFVRGFWRPHDLYVVAPGGGDETLLAAGLPGGSMVWSPDSSAIALASEEDLIVVGVPSRQTTDLGPGSDPTWSPDGTRLMFEDSGVIYAVDWREGTDRERVIEGTDPAWRPLRDQVGIDGP